MEALFASEQTLLHHSTAVQTTLPVESVIPSLTSTGPLSSVATSSSSTASSSSSLSSSATVVGGSGRGAATSPSGALLHHWVTVELTFAVVAGLAKRYRRVGSQTDADGKALVAMAFRVVSMLLASPVRSRIDVDITDTVCEVCGGVSQTPCVRCVGVYHTHRV